MSPVRRPGEGQEPGPAHPRRVRVTSPRHDARRGADRPSRTAELAQQTELGEVYLAALMRAQLRISLATVAVTAIVLGGIPALFLLVPALTQVRIGPAPLPWVVIGVFLYPLLAVGARIYVRQCERVERDFIDLVTRT